MLNSISYLEISCNYNKVDLKLFCGDLSHKGSSRVVVYHNRRYFFSYDADDDAFYLVNKYGVCVGMLVGTIFKFYVSYAPEIGLNLVWGLLAKLNVYPVKSF